MKRGVMNLKKVKNILLILGLTILVSFTNFEVFFNLSAQELGNQQFKWLVIDGVFAILIVSLTYLIYKKVRKNDKDVSIKNKLLMTLGFTLLAVGINYLYGLFIDTTANQNLVNEMRMQAPILAAFQVRLFAPIIEEMIWRGIFMNLFFMKNTAISKVCQVFTSGLFFGFLHTYSINFELLLYSIIGWILASTYYFTKDIRCPIIVHLALNNI